jgi:ATPase subunit of ABC transporter with duplicated ATPase domains
LAKHNHSIPQLRVAYFSRRTKKKNSRKGLKEIAAAAKKIESAENESEDVEDESGDYESECNDDSAECKREINRMTSENIEIV